MVVGNEEISLQRKLGRNQRNVPLNQISIFKLARNQKSSTEHTKYIRVPGSLKRITRQTYYVDVQINYGGEIRGVSGDLRYH